MKRALKADVFDVWGKPPSTLSSKLSDRQMMLLRRYVDAVASKVYRLAYDLGTERGIDQATEAMRRVREAVNRGRK